MAIKFLFLIVFAAFASAINGRTLPIEKRAADVEAMFYHHYLPPYGGAFGGFRGGAGAGYGGVGVGFGGRYGNGGLGGGFGAGDESSPGGGTGTGTGGIGIVESGGFSGGDGDYPLGDQVIGGLHP